jgi:hypothetical protein
LEFAKIKADSDLKSIASSTPFIGIYEEGKLKYNLISSSDADYECLSDAAKFYQWMDARIRYPNYYSIDLATLRKFINDDKKTFVVEHLWSVCPDCNFLASSFLNDYLKTAALDDKFYYIDCYVEGIKLSNGVSNDVQWTNYRNEFGLSASGSKFGFGLGHVPTIQYYKEGTLTNALTYMNDDDYSHSLSVQDFFTVSADGTYFKDSPYIGVTFVRDNGIMIDNNMYYVDKENNKLYKSIYDSGIKAYKNTFAEADFAYSINENKVTVDDKVYTVAYGTRDAKQVHRETTANFFNTKVKNFIERYL